jgi:sterol desaturase/sphingolipid hydroxylase (fatty acid hydroxylase superfamily)
MMLFVVIAIGLAFIILERIIPDQKLPHVKGWWTRVIIINCAQLGIIFLGAYTWDKWFLEISVFELGSKIPAVLGGLISYLIITFVFYWWHRLRHDINALWVTFHQLHHSAQRIEAVTSFYKHPLEIIADSLLIAAVNHTFLGIGMEGAAWTLLYTAVAEYFYHMNIRTPHWLGYIFQRPEMHRVHHERNRHYKNFSDIPLWDMLFGTFENPPVNNKLCGFRPEREEKFLTMLMFRNVNDKYDPKKKYSVR